MATTPLTDEQALEAIRQMQEAGYGDDDIKAALWDQYDPAMVTPKADVAKAERGIWPPPPKPHMAEKILRPAAIIGGTMAGGALGRGAGVARQVLTEVAGAFTGDIAYQTGRKIATGQEIEP